MRHVSYERQAVQLPDAALDGDAKAQYVVTGLITEFSEQLFAGPVNEATMRSSCRPGVSVCEICVPVVGHT